MTPTITARFDDGPRKYETEVVPFPPPDEYVADVAIEGFSTLPPGREIPIVEWEEHLYRLVEPEPTINPPERVARYAHVGYLRRRRAGAGRSR